jgi:hypothetical protein
MYEPRLCTLHELRTVYSLEDMYDMLEMIDVQETLKEEGKPPPPQPKGRRS